MTFKKTYSDTPVLPDGQVTTREGCPGIAREKACSKLRQAHDAEQKLQAEIGERVAKLEAAREAAVGIRDSFDTAINERNATRKDLIFYTGSFAGSQARLLELQTWIEAHFRDSPTVEQFSELYRHEKMVQWLPAIIERTKTRLADLDKQITRLAKDNDLAVPV